MNEQIRDEVVLLLNIDNVDADEQIKILSICASVLSSEKYMIELVETLDNIFTQPDGVDLSSEFTRIVLNILNLNQKVVYKKKEVCPSRMKYVIYCVIYYYLLKHKLEILDNCNIGNIRLLYCNSWDLIAVNYNNVIIPKEKCDCFCGLFGGDDKIHIN